MPFVQHDSYLAHPDTWRGTCAFCGASQRTLEGGRAEKVWDTGLKIDDSDGIYGGVFICESCVRELAADAGMVNEGQAVELQAEANDLRAERDRLLVDVDDLTTPVESLRVYNDRNPQDPAVISQPATAASPANAVGEARTTPAPGEHFPSDSEGNPIPNPPPVGGTPSTPPVTGDANAEPIPAPGAPDQTADQTPPAASPDAVDPGAAAADTASTIPSGNVPTTATKADENVPSAGDATSAPDANPAPEASPPA